MNHDTIVRLDDLDFHVFIVVFLGLVLLLDFDHVVFDVFDVGLDVIEDIVGDDPTEKVELADRGFDAVVFIEVKHDSVSPTKGVEELFRVRFELGSVAEIDIEVDHVVVVLLGDHRIILL